MSGSHMKRSPRTTGAERIYSRSAWRATCGVTKREAELLVALIAAQVLGYEGATTPALLSAKVSRNAIANIMSLARRGLVDFVGFAGGDMPRTKVWAATSAAFALFETPLPKPVPAGIETEAGRDELMLERAGDRRKRRDRQAKRSAA